MAPWLGLALDNGGLMRALAWSVWVAWGMAMAMVGLLAYQYATVTDPIGTWCSTIDGGTRVTFQVSGPPECERIHKARGE